MRLRMGSGNKSNGILSDLSCALCVFKGRAKSRIPGSWRESGRIISLD